MGAHEDEKRAAAEAAAALIEPGMAVGLGSGSTAALFVRALAERRLDALRCVATSVATHDLALGLGLAVEAFDALDRLDVAVDGADQVGVDLWVVKGGGGAHTREKVAAAAADRFVVIVSEDKLVERLGPPVPLELLGFGLPATLRHLRRLGPTTLREAPPSPDGNVIADFGGDLDDPAALGAALSAIPGVVDHGLFPPSMVSEVLVGRSGGAVDRLTSP